MEPTPERRPITEERRWPYDLRFQAAALPAHRHMHSQDRSFYSSPGGVLIVCDGIGGRAAPELAAQTAIDVLGTRLMSIPTSGIAPDELQRLMVQTMIVANEEVMRKTLVEIFAPDSGRVKCGGTTATAGKLFEWQGKLWMGIAHVGDSSAEVLRNGSLRKITDDDNNEPGGNILTNYLGRYLLENVHFYLDPVAAGDTWVFFSDGLGNNLAPEDRRLKLMRGKRANDLAQQVYRRTGGFFHSRYRDDDITVVTLDVSELRSQHQEHDLTGGRSIEVSYQGMPIEVVLSKHPVLIGTGRDLRLDIANPSAFVIIDQKLYAASRGKKGIRMLGDNHWDRDLGTKDYRFAFGRGVGKEHCQIRRNGTIISIADLSHKGGTVVRTYTPDSKSGP